MTRDQVITGAVFKEMLLYGASLLAKNRAMVDELNVFPVPDGDTGTNMSMTMDTAVKEIAAAETSSIESVSALMARGALRGARGNSGVILSQIFRGMAQSFEGKNEVNGQDWADALENGSKAAYKAVMKPKEGTILTVIKYVAEQAQKNAKAGENVYKIIDNNVFHAEEILQKTPEMLSVLKEAGVVDSGGMGLLVIFKGFKMCLDGDALEDMKALDVSLSAEENVVDLPADGHFSENDDVIHVHSEEDIKFAYCTEFFVEHLKPNFKQEDADNLLEKMQEIGDSVVVVNDPDLIKVHVHTNVPGKALQMALRLGELNGVKIENMKEQHREVMRERKAKQKEFGMVVVSAGEGLEKIFKDLAVDVVISGGQTMNPSAEDIEKAVNKANARNIFVLPNNKNIILAAKQAAELFEKSDEVNVYVIETTTVVEGVAAALAFSDGEDAKQKQKMMEDAAKNVISGSVTYAVRDTVVQGKKINKQDFMGMVEGDIIESGKDIALVLDHTIEKMMEEDGEFISIFYGKDVAQEDAQSFAAKVEEKYPDADVVLQYGGQPLYYYFISVE